MDVGAGSMEKVEIRVEQLRGIAVDRHWHAIFGVAGGTIGRGGQNKLVLPDEDVGVARVHAMVRLESDGAFIANLCERRSIVLNGNELCSGQELPLPLGAAISIGPYTLRAVAPGSALPAWPEIEPQPTALEGHADAASKPELLNTCFSTAAGSGGMGDSVNPFAFLGTPTDSSAMLPQPGSPSEFNPELTAAQVDPKSQPVKRSETSHPTQCEQSLMLKLASDGVPPSNSSKARPLVIPAGFDTFAPSGATAASAGRTPWGEPTGACLVGGLADVTGIRNDGLLLTLPQLKDVAHRLDDPVHGGLPEALDRHLELDPLRLFSETAEIRPVALAGTNGNGGDPLGQVFSLPRRAPDATAPRPAVPLEPGAAPASAGLSPRQVLSTAVLHEGDSSCTSSTPEMPGPMPSLTSSAFTVREAAALTDPVVLGSAAASFDEQRLIAAFLEGAGLAAGRVPMRVTPEFMRDFGHVLQVAIQGTIDLMAARSEIKREFRADVTLITSGANNPLKFLPTAEGVIMQMLGRSFPGFMPPVPAMKEAYQDLKVHQLALMAGIRAAYVEALTRFDPVALEMQTPTLKGVIGRWSATRRKAALWDGYRQTYLDIRRHAEDDLMAYSGRTFVQAYEATADAAGQGT